ncbi:aminoacyl tRNA synthase complex-interacting multifunctional protein 2-like isoform X2 [Achroia grisella]|uniref:aminoacyl tRNA synthase complex-interacting multifunctional protein 2-like isoform X2 n=1 Tax=Achroia grisella TaxID=688607 RepID=UPI0027D20963|nr:aminoacyl tRNA synthase complex-interacting multifunctional protein 2-like isoform X2 [Achroia grisella]
MMYRMKNIIKYDDQLSLPKCMYRMKNPNHSVQPDDCDIHISEQAQISNNKMAELEKRQDLLLKKLDTLYDRIKTISAHCKFNGQDRKININIQPEEIVLIVSPDNWPWFLKIILSQSNIALKTTWHIHSSVPNDKALKIEGFMKNLQTQTSVNNAVMTLRLIFKCVSADTELKLSPLAIPITGNVNVLRYLSLVFPSVVFYDHEDHTVDGLLDICHILERTPEKNKEIQITKLFLNCKNWIYKNEFTIVDLAAYNIAKQWKTIPKSVPKVWYENCNKLCLSV